MRFTSCFALSLLLLSSCATVQLTTDETAALKVLQRYLELDRSGVRLDDSRQALDAPLVTWDSEPGWDSLVIATGWSIGRPQMDNGKMRIRVRYDVAGIVDGTSFLSSDTSEAEHILAENTEVVYTLIAKDGHWKIESPTLPPHVGFPAIKKHLATVADKGVLQEIDDAEYVAKLRGARAGHCNCGRLDF